MKKTFRALVVDGTKYGVVGGIGALTDLVLFNFILWMSISTTDQAEPIIAKAFSTLLAAGLTYIGHGYWTFRNRGGTRRNIRTILRFVFVTTVGLLISIAIVGSSHYLFGFQSVLANNIANLIALAVSATIRFIATRHWVFRNANH